MKILFVTAGTNKAAATRYRVMQYLPSLERSGINYKVISVTSRFLTEYMIRSPEMAVWKRLIYYTLFLIERFIRSWLIILRASMYDRIFLQRVTFPLGLEKILKKLNPNIIFDIDDAIYLPDVQGDDPITKLKKLIKESEVKAILRVSKCVIVENEYIKKYVSRFCPRIYKIPGPIDTDRYTAKKAYRTGDIVVGWIGSPATTPYLHMLDDVFKQILENDSDVSIHLIGAGKYSLDGYELKKIPWSAENEIEELQKFDIGVMSMPDNKWTRGKLGCKMLQYMALGIPTIASDTITNREMLEDGVNGFLVKTEEEWVQAIKKLIDSPSLRRDIGFRGRQTIEEKCSLDKARHLLEYIFKHL